ncbi:bifunctional diguanylate cyclase/phosphodiesterase [Thiomicrorhabdus cannonii]|uniref:bifunctional diguanylate cyclase/phosphodiesterase n=1 Tax=Thiomicrorhabdus cannonii TaxID=2748011 RepID=UPI0015B957FD|nr:EAL domain-containing protein [Thiomicrorhabdus cannonii]
MKTLNHLFSTQAELDAFLHDEMITAYQGDVLLQVFSSTRNHATIESILHAVIRQCPDIHIIGASSGGEIINGHITHQQTVLSFTLFENTRVTTFIHPDKVPAEANLLAKDHIKDTTRCAIVFAEAGHPMAQQLLHDLAAIAPQLVVAGGYAADTSHSAQTYVIHQNRLYPHGVVIAFLHGEQLRAANGYLLNWVPLGQTFEVTATRDNTIISLNHKPVKQVYQEYLGKNVTENLPENIIQFPIIKETENIPVARCVINANSQGEFVYAGAFEPGDKVRFSTVDDSTLIHEAYQKACHLKYQLQPQSLYVYSCSARKMFLKELMQDEIEALCDARACSGLFTYGEFFHTASHNYILNITTTYLALSEAPLKPVSISEAEVMDSIGENHQSTLRSLMHLVNKTTHDLQSQLSLKQQYKQVLEQASIMVETDANGVILRVNHAFEKVTGYCAHEVVGHTHRMISHPDTQDDVFAELWQTITQGNIWQGVIKNRCKNGSSYYVQTVVAPIYGEDGELLHYLGISNDITEQIHIQRQIEAERTDSLTGLPSRMQLMEDKKRLNADKLALINLQNFKAYNDFYGLKIGDKILMNFASFLEALAATERLILYRVYGDRFALLPLDSMPLETFMIVLRKIIGAVHDHEIPIENSVIDLEIEIGVGYGKQHLLQLAETALQSTKQNNQHTIAIAREEPQRDQEHLHWLKHIRQALQSGHIINLYQPIFNPKDPGTPKYEALVRLKLPNGEIIPPSRFLEIAKPTRHYLRITQTVMRNAFQMAAKKGHSVSINLSIQDIENPGLHEEVLLHLATHQGGKIIFEITESESISDFEIVKEFIDDVKRHGAEVAIDDFGSGYSNFSYLVNLNADYIKIDGSLVQKILTDDKTAMVVEGIIQMGRGLGFKTVAEFVSDQQIAERLLLMGIDFMQGYYYGKPQYLE